MTENNYYGKNDAVFHAVTHGGDCIYEVCITTIA